MKNTTQLLMLFTALTLTVQAAARKPFLINKKAGLLTEKQAFFKKPQRSILMKAGDDKDAPKNVIKINLSQLVLTNLSFQYEMAFHKNMSAALGFSALLPRSIPGALLPDNNAGTGIGIISPTFKGWSLTPEFRLYPGQKEEHQAPHGFYLAPFFRYSKYTVSADYGTNISGVVNNLDFKMTYAGYNMGLMLGAQWIVGKHVTIDWWIAGGGAGKAKFQMDATASAANMSQADQDNLKAELKSDFSGAKLLGASEPVVETTSNSAKVTVSGLPMSSFRGFGLCIGFAF